MAWVLESGTDRVEFGCELTGLGLMTVPEVKPEIEAGSFANPRGDGRRFGRDYRTGQVVALRVEARPDHRPVDAVWRDLLRVWRADKVRLRGGVMASLTAESGRRAYGRPRDVASDLSAWVLGTARAVLEFECADDLWYGPASVLSMRFAPVASGGLPIPADVPFVIDGGDGEADSILEVGGDVDTWGVYTLYGPIVDPWIDVPGVGVLRFKVSLPYDGVLTVDTRPWARWVKRDGNAAPGALLAAGSRLSDMALSPGSYRVIFGGYDPSGTSRLEVLAEPAFTSF